MAPGQDTQLEKVIDEVLKSGDVHALAVFLQRDIYEGTPMKCSKQFLSKLDRLVCRCLDQKDSKSASLGLTVVYKCGEKLKLPGVGQGLSGVICQGLIQMMVQWFEKCRKLWIQCGPQWNEPLFNLSEDFFDALTVVHEACKEGTYKITESFLYALGQLGVDSRIYILIRKEAIRKFNLILDKIPTELKKERKILTSQEASDIMLKLAGQILEGGDYDLQTALMEALCRMATPDQRKEMADRWFSMEHVASAFAKIRDAEFETDCRKFLNLVNGMQGDRRRVYSYPCLEVYLDKYELLMPADEKLDEFWIDFNLGSHSISFYFSLADGEMQEGQWETICISENEVQSYTVTEEGKRKVLQLKLSEVVVVGGVEGSNLTIHFSSSLDILQAARSVYGHSKNKGFVGKMGTSVVKTTVKIIMEENNSQVVPESQVSLGESEKNTVPYLLPASSAHIQMVTPARMRISESTTFISNSAGGSVHSASSLSAVKPSKDNFVPDTQPRPVKNMSFNWNKLSVSEMVTMPTQKINTVSRPEPHSNSAQQQEHPTLALRLSVPGSGPINHKQLHTELTQRLQRVLSEKNQDHAPQEPAATQRKMSGTRGDSKRRGSADQCASTLGTSNKQQAQRNGLAKGNSKGRMSLKADVALNKAPVKAPTTVALQEKIQPNVKAQTNRALSSKEKSDAKVAESMVKLISSHYEINNINQSWTPLHINNGIHESSGLHNTTEKGQPVTKEKRYMKKHLFSDTDTDYAMTEVSWLRESSRKPKPKVAKYSRQAPIKPKAESPHTSYEIPDLPPPSPKHVKDNTKPNKQKKHNVKERVVQPKKTVKPAAAPSRPHAAGGRPKRAVHTSTKSYREPDTDDSQSESATPAVPKQQRPENVLQETSKLRKKKVIPVLEEMNALKDSWAARQTSFCPSPPFVEKMRSAERSAPTLDLTCSPLLTPRGSPLPASPDSACQDTPSPILLLPKPHSTVSSKGNFKPSSSYSAEKKFSTSKTQSIQSALSLSSLRGQTPAPHPPIGLSAAEISPVQQHLSPAPRSPLSLSLPLLTSTLLDLDKQSMPSPPQSPFPEDTINNDHLYGFSKVSSVSQVSLSQSSTMSSMLSCRVKDCPRPSRKRHITSTSESEEDEKEDGKESKMRGQRSPRMKPRKLFKSFAEVSAVGEVSQVMSSSHTVSSSHWEAEVRGGDMDMDEDLELPGSDLNPSDLCQQFSSDLKKKFQNRYKTMEFYNKQSLKTVQQHVSSLNMQVTKYRTQRLAQVQKALLQEIDKLEQDDTVLKRMEKDLTIHWKKQTVAFRSYQEQGTKRNETLKKALHSNVCHSLEYEQRIFTSKMCLIRKDMKSVQDRLLSEMQDGEIQSVKRGLHALFFP
ncbi:synaptonemal complex protein 2 [Seriola lalandi dorsalis]|uniref:synaptonemal complex protein 2 n=1 Tax=Seriola lalandi dorsalis TaxID=1841481 RepID=UPI000C6FB961|nr:synaptonemal complex protein 2 [Seriola lalandi dorsalis]